MIQPTIDVYVINLPYRRQRCKCMEKQLESFKGRIFRQEASTGLDCGLHTTAHKDIKQGVAGLFCSNYRIWQKAVNSSADYIVILEDDAIWKPDTFPRLAQVLVNCPGINYLVVDPWGARGPQDTDTCQREAVHHLPRTKIFATQMQVIKVGALETVLELAKTKGIAAMDDWNAANLGGILGLAHEWRPGLVQQKGRHYRGQKRWPHVHAPEECSGPEMDGSDIGVLTKGRWHYMHRPPYDGIDAAEGEGQLKCPVGDASSLEAAH